MTTYHRQSAGHWASIRTECATILVQQSSSILATRHARQIHALQLVGVVWSWARRGVERVVRSRGGIVGKMGGQHVVWQGGGSDGWDVEVLITQTTHWVWLKGDRERDKIGENTIKESGKNLIFKFHPCVCNLFHHIVVFLTDSSLSGTKSSLGKLTYRDRAWVDGQCCLQQSDNLEKINKNYIGDYKRPKCHETLLSEIINGRDEKTAHHHSPKMLNPALCCVT